MEPGTLTVPAGGPLLLAASTRLPGMDLVNRWQLTVAARYQDDGRPGQTRPRWKTPTPSPWPTALSFTTKTNRATSWSTTPAVPSPTPAAGQTRDEPARLVLADPDLHLSRIGEPPLWFVSPYDLSHLASQLRAQKRALLKRAGNDAECHGLAERADLIGVHRYCPLHTLRPPDRHIR